MTREQAEQKAREIVGDCATPSAPCRDIDPDPREWCNTCLKRWKLAALLLQVAADAAQAAPSARPTLEDQRDCAEEILHAIGFQRGRDWNYNAMRVMSVLKHSGFATVAAPSGEPATTPPVPCGHTILSEWFCQRPKGHIEPCGSPVGESPERLALQAAVVWENGCDRPEPPWLAQAQRALRGHGDAAPSAAPLTSSERADLIRALEHHAQLSLHRALNSGPSGSQLEEEHFGLVKALEAIEEAGGIEAVLGHVPPQAEETPA